MHDPDLRQARTEAANAATHNLDLLPTREMLLRINDQDRLVAEAVRKEVDVIAQVVDMVADAFRSGGRLHLFGAGTSGRLAVLDASECPPTFGVPDDLFQGHIAGGRRAVTDAVEGAEDDADQGERDVAIAGVTALDVVIAITASGRTPYCLGVARAARRAGARTVGLVCNPATPLHTLTSPTITTVTGEEVLAGSTRLKAGTAQKLVLNMISTGAMIRVGRTYGNLMVGVQAKNVKLRERAARLVAEVTGDEERARPALEACRWDVRVACLMIRHGVDAAAAAERLERSQGSLRRALEA